MKKLASLLLMILIAGAAMKYRRDAAREQRNREAIKGLYEPGVRPTRPRRQGRRPQGRHVRRDGRPASGAQARFEAKQRRR